MNCACVIYCADENGNDSFNNSKLTGQCNSLVQFSTASVYVAPQKLELPERPLSTNSSSVVIVASSCVVLLLVSSLTFSSCSIDVVFSSATVSWLASGGATGAGIGAGVSVISLASQEVPK